MCFNSSPPHVLSAEPWMWESPAGMSDIMPPCKTRYSLTHKGVTGKVLEIGEIVKKQPKPMETNKDKNAHELLKYDSQL